jgi:general secretion pathway protein G
MWRRRSFRRRGNEGFTLIELMVVLVILGLLAALVMPRLFGRTEEARVTAAKVQLRVLEDALHQYEIDNGALPAELKGLVEQPSDAKRWRPGGYLDRGSLPKDPWGNDYVYRVPGATGDFDLYSRGADGEEGGDGPDADVFSREAQ